MTQNVISGKAVHMIGARITPEEVKRFVVQKRVQLRSGVFLLGTVERRHRRKRRIKLENSKALATRPGPWRRTWDMEYFLKALKDMENIGGQPQEYQGGFQ